MLSSEPDEGLDLTNCVIMTWAEIKSRTLNLLSHRVPLKSPVLKRLLGVTELRRDWMRNSMNLKITPRADHAKGRARKEARGARRTLTSLLPVPLGLCEVLAQLLGDLHVAQVALHAPVRLAVRLLLCGPSPLFCRAGPRTLPGPSSM